MNFRTKKGTCFVNIRFMIIPSLLHHCHQLGCQVGPKGEADLKGEEDADGKGKIWEGENAHLAIDSGTIGEHATSTPLLVWPKMGGIEVQNVGMLVHNAATKVQNITTKVKNAGIESVPLRANIRTTEGVPLRPADNKANDNANDLCSEMGPKVRRTHNLWTHPNPKL